MKAFSILFLILFSNKVIAQTKHSVYIYDSTVDGGHIRIVEYPTAKIFLRLNSLSIDTSGSHKGVYVEIFTFQETGMLMNRIITLKFDKPVNSCELKCPNGVSQVTTIPNEEKTEYKFVVNQIKADEFSFVIYSKEKVYTKIDEVSKYIPVK